MQALRLRASDFGERVWVFKDASGLLARLAVPGQGGIETEERHPGVRLRKLETGCGDGEMQFCKS